MAHYALLNNENFVTTTSVCFWTVSKKAINAIPKAKSEANIPDPKNNKSDLIVVVFICMPLVKLPIALIKEKKTSGIATIFNEFKNRVFIALYRPAPSCQKLPMIRPKRRPIIFFCQSFIIISKLKIS